MILPPSIGNMRRRLTVQFKTETANGSGGLTRSWSTQATVWGNIQPARAEKKMGAWKLTHIVTHKIYTRFRTDIDQTMRIVYGSRVFQIHGVLDIDEKRKYLELSCQEGVGS